LIHFKSPFLLLLIVSVSASATSPSTVALRARDLGIQFDGTPGKQNSITDVNGTLVGHTTLTIDEGSNAIRTGVTAVLPAGHTQSKVPASYFSLNGNGEMTGTHWISESGFLEGPVLLTNTFSVGLVRDAVRKWGESRFPNNDPDLDDAFMLPVVAETWDGFLSNIKAHAVTEGHVFSALDSANAGPPLEGGVGGGTGMVCFEFKCGIGTSSRVIENYTVGVLVQANFGDRDELLVRGVPVGEQISDLLPDLEQPLNESLAEHSPLARKKDGSIIVIVATDAPLLPSQLNRIAKRATVGLARTGSIAHNSSGDLFLAYSTAVPRTDAEGNELWSAIPNSAMDPLFRATADATEEAILNALVAGRTTIGKDYVRVHGIPHERLLSLLKDRK